MSAAFSGEVCDIRVVTPHSPEEKENGNRIVKHGSKAAESLCVPVLKYGCISAV